MHNPEGSYFIQPLATTYAFLTGQASPVREIVELTKSFARPQYFLSLGQVASSALPSGVCSLSEAFSGRVGRLQEPLRVGSAGSKPAAHDLR